jgi:hypothetical protein
MTDQITGSESTVWGEIEGRTITFPMEVPVMDAATLVFSVPAAAAQALLPGDAFEVVDVGGGTAQFVLALVDYVDNPWGDYLEINPRLPHPARRCRRRGPRFVRVPHAGRPGVHLQGRQRRHGFPQDGAGAVDGTTR